MCEAKDLTATRTAVTLARALAGSPYDAADALHTLTPESKAPGREIAPDELRYALSTLSPGRILPDTAPTVSKVVHALLTTAESLNQRDLADRAGVSTQSVRNHRNILEAFDLLRETEGSLRFAFPFRDERTDQGRGAAVLPSYAVGNPDREAHTRPPDVLFDAVDRLIEDPSQLADPEAWPWLSLLEALLDVETADAPHERAVVVGHEPEQTALSSAPSAPRPPI